MATAGVQFKIMPESLNINLKQLKKEVKETIESFDSGVFNEAIEEPVAFGLKALKVTFALSESEEVDKVENALKELSGASSVELTDYRRAVG